MDTKVKPMPKLCACHIPPVYNNEYEIFFVGIDKTGGRFAEVNVEKCKQCGTKWISYSFEYEYFTGSFRWYRGILGNELNLIKPENVIAYLESIDWYIFGGSYYNSNGTIGKGSIEQING